jgi:3-phenylpropionate/trans-cinnamate dioxygenase ferredoxin reductase subunit
MTRADLLVIGAGPAGHAAAMAYRTAGGTGPVTLLAGEHRAPYERPPLSKELLRSEVGPEALPLAEHPAAYDEREITVRHGRALALHPDEHRVGLEGGEDITYRSCVLATGAQPLRPPIPGADRPGVHVLRTVADALALRAAAVPGAHVLVLGSGFIGCEAAASLRMRGCAVTLVTQEPAPQAARLGDAVAERFAALLARAGVETRYERELTAIGDGLRAQLSDGGEVDADIVLLAAGVAPDVALARAAGLSIYDSGEIVADAALRTSAPGVLACGDCCRAEHALAGRPLHVEHWGDALAQGEVAGTTAAGRAAAWDTVPGFWSTIGTDTFKYAAWGDGFATTRLVDHGDGAFTAWYADEDGTCVGVLTHDRDPDYETGLRLIAEGAGA